MHTFSKFADAKSGAAITVKVSPRAKKTELAGLMDDGTIKVRVAAAPEAGAANQTLIEFLAQTFGIPANQIEIMGGFSSERKLISLIGVTPGAVEATVARLSPPAKRRPKAPAAKARKKPAKKK